MFFEFAAAKGSRQMTSSAASRARPRGFATTRWSLIQQANQGNEAPARAPMEELCQAYWLPVYAFMRLCGDRLVMFMKHRTEHRAFSPVCCYEIRLLN